VCVFGIYNIHIIILIWLFDKSLTPIIGIQFRFSAIENVYTLKNQTNVNYTNKILNSYYIVVSLVTNLVRHLFKF